MTDSGGIDETLFDVESFLNGIEPYIDSASSADSDESVDLSPYSRLCFPGAFACVGVFMVVLGGATLMRKGVSDKRKAKARVSLLLGLAVVFYSFVLMR
jgi:hypothetical protein